MVVIGGRQKLTEYLARGTSVVVVIDPDDILNLDDVVPGFRCAVREILR